MSNIYVADRSDYAGINRVISANQSKKEDEYRFPYLLGSCEDVLPNKGQIIFVAKESNEVIAFLVLHDSDLYHSSCSAEFEVVVHPDYRSREKHHGENILRHAMHYAENKTSIDRLIAKVLKRNTSSINLLKKCGFIREGRPNDGIGYKMTYTIFR